MGWANCRFSEQTGCRETGSRHYTINVGNLDLILDVPEIWWHYAVDHNIQPSEREREVVMQTDVSTVSGQRVNTRSMTQPEKVQVLYVEKAGDAYSHSVGEAPDREFIDKLERIVAVVEPVMTKGLPGDR